MQFVFHKCKYNILQKHTNQDAIKYCPFFVDIVCAVWNLFLKLTAKDAVQHVYINRPYILFTVLLTIMFSNIYINNCTLFLKITYLTLTYFF